MTNLTYRVSCPEIEQILKPFGVSYSAQIIATEIQLIPWIRTVDFSGDEPIVYIETETEDEDLSRTRLKQSMYELELLIMDFMK